MMNFLLGVLFGLALVQFYPPSAKIGAWVATKARDLFYRLVTGAKG